MRQNVQSMCLAIVWIMGIGVSATHSQTTPAYYYPAAGDYATRKGIVQIPAPGYYYNEPTFRTTRVGRWHAPITHGSRTLVGCSRTRRRGVVSAVQSGFPLSSGRRNVLDANDLPHGSAVPFRHGDLFRQRLRSDNTIV